MRTAKLITMGCKVNQYDTQSMRETLRRNGYTIVDDETSQQRTDLYLINTCTVTNAADQKARQAIRRAIRQNPNTKVLEVRNLANRDTAHPEPTPRHRTRSARCCSGTRTFQQRRQRCRKTHACAYQSARRMQRFLYLLHYPVRTG